MDEWSYAVARSLVQSATLGRRTNYPEVAAQVGWEHPQGRGMGKVLDQILHYCSEMGYPPLTTILVKKGTFLPPSDAIKQIHSVIGKLDMKDAQEKVFAFDWNKVSDFRAETEQLPFQREFWLTSFWGYSPETWGCIGFDDNAKRQQFINRTKPGALIAIYITKNKGPVHMRGFLVGIYEVSHQRGHVRDFISGDQWARKQADPETKGKWEYSLKVTRAWHVVEEDWVQIEKILPATYGDYDARFEIGPKGVPINADEIDNIFDLTVYEVPVFGSKEHVESGFQPFSNILKPSRAISPSKEPYWVGETDGPKFLYIMTLEGDIATYLGRDSRDLEDMMIVKVGFSKSPLTRRNQIQSAYPDGKYNWNVFKPESLTGPPPYPDADTAIIGENRMKERMIEAGAESLGREFFLADLGTVLKVWVAGRMAIENDSSSRKRSQD